MTEEDLKNMRLHDWVETKSFDVLRVVGGWIYNFKKKMRVNGGQNQWVMTSVFVPEQEYHGRMDV